MYVTPPWRTSKVGRFSVDLLPVEDGRAVEKERVREDCGRDGSFGNIEW